MTQGLAPCEHLVEGHAVEEGLRDESWEVGRLVLAPQYRSGPEVLKRCLYLTLVHLIETTTVENLFASCTPVLARLYRRFGFDVLVREASRDANGHYSLIHGTVPAVLRALSGGPVERQVAEAILAVRERNREAVTC
jgi:predicted GNAT family N-acyltransferase